MKFLTLLFFCTTLAFQVNAHEYFFGFCELSYNNDKNEYEGTLSLSAHDIQEYLEYKDIVSEDITTLANDKSSVELISLALFSGFRLQSEGNEIELKVIGFEVLKNGITQFYFTSGKTEKAEELNITFDLMMDVYPNQQNKITYKNGFTSQTAIFLQNKTQASLKL
jgi:hypothetical protein